mgnify:FL=1
MYMNFYNALSIFERTCIETPKLNKQPIKEAYTYWEKLTNNNLNKLLSTLFSIDIDFIKNHYNAKYNDFLLHNDWRKDLQDINFSEIYFLKNDSHIKDTVFYPFFIPFINYYRNKLQEIIPDQINITPSCFENLEKQLLKNLLSIAQKTLILEINEKKETDSLEGNTPEKRYFHFCNMLNNDKNFKLSLLEEYPVLFRLLTHKTKNYLQNIKNIITNFLNDKNAIIKIFDFESNDLSHLTNISLNSGDSHNDKTVSILTFNYENKLVYKPRNLLIDEKFNNFVCWINEQSNNNLLPIKTTKLINKKTYGWSEYVEFKECENIEEVGDFYTSLGQILGLLYLLNTTDMHFENIIANRNTPILVDLETLFHHTIIEEEVPLTPVLKKAADILNNSVLSTGILPITTGEFDLSGSGNTENTTIPFEMEEIKYAYTDNIKLDKVTNAYLKSGKNYPKLNNSNLLTSDYVNEITKGFENIYNFFLNKKNSINNILKSFKNIPTRKIFRNTQQYSTLISLGYHPDFLRNQIDRDFLFARLYDETEETPELLPLIRYEIQQLNLGNIPYFETLSNSTDLKVDESQILKNYFQVTGYQECIKKLNSLSVEDLQYQKKS